MHNFRLLLSFCILFFTTLKLQAQLDCSNAPLLTINKTIQGNTTNSKNNNSKYNNDNFWQNTGPEDVYKLEWPGGTVTIKLSNKTAALDLIILRSCDPSNYANGGANTGTKETSFTFNLPAGTYYIVVDGWQLAKGSYDLTVIQDRQTVSVFTDVFNRVQRTFYLLFKDSTLYEQTATGAKVMLKGVESISANFGYVTNAATGEGVQNEVMAVKRYGQALPKVFLNENFNTDYLKQKLVCSTKSFLLYGDQVFDGARQTLSGCDILRCENGYTLAHQNDGKIKYYNINGNNWVDVLQIITIAGVTYYVSPDSTVWAFINNNQSFKIGSNAKLLQDNDNQLIKIDAQGKYQRWNGSSWSDLTPKYISVSPEMTNEAFWFFMQPKPILESNNHGVDHKKGLTFDKNDKLQIELIPATGNCERFLWRTIDAGNGKRLLINKAKGDSLPLLLTANGTFTFTTGQGVKEWEIKQSDINKYGTNAYQLIGANATKALTFNSSVVSENPSVGLKNQTWLFQFNQMVKDYFLPLPTKANLIAHYVDNPNVNVNTSADAIAASYNKFLKGNHGVTFFATNTSSDWVLVNYYFIITNMFNAVVAPKPSEPKIDQNLIKTLDALKGQSLILINKNDLNSAIQNMFFTTWQNKQNAAQFRGQAAYLDPKKAILANEELTCKTGIVNRPLDNTFRRFDHGVHEFTHAIQQLCGYIPIVDANNMCPNEVGLSSECFCFDVQARFNSAAPAYHFPGLRAFIASKSEFIKKIFNDGNTWMPPVDLRQDGYNPSSAALPVFGILACGDAPTVPLGKTIQGNTANGRNNVNNYNNDPWWQSTGPEAIHKLVWPGGEGNIKLSNKSAPLDLLFLNSCDNNDFFGSGGGNSGIAESNLPFNRPAGTYYIVVDGWAQARGTYDLLVLPKGVTSTLDVLLNKSIRAYPNPFSEILNIEVKLDNPGSIEYEIVDALGRTLRTNKSNTPNTKHNLIIRDLDYKGVLFVKVKSNYSQGFVKIIKD